MTEHVNVWVDGEKLWVNCVTEDNVENCYAGETTEMHLYMNNSNLEETPVETMGERNMDLLSEISEPIKPFANIFESLGIPSPISYMIVVIGGMWIIMRIINFMTFDNFWWARRSRRIRRTLSWNGQEWTKEKTHNDEELSLSQKFLLYLGVARVKKIE